MSTFIQLVNDLERESGTIYQAQRLTTTVSPAARQEKMVEWIKEAWLLIQNSRNDWRWMRSEFTSALVIDQKRYAASDFSISNFGTWLPARTKGISPFTLYDASIGQEDENEIRPVEFDDWKARWDRGVHDAGRPTQWSVSPANELCIGAKPDKAYTFRGEYIRTAQVLSADTDVPICPARFHQAIVWRAMMLMGAHDEAVIVVQHGQGVFGALLRDMVADSAGTMFS